MAIAKLMVAEQRYEFSPEAEKAFRDYLGRRMRQPRFANARSVRNAIERARLRQASRIVTERKHEIGKADLLCIQAEDILKSRVFDEGEETRPDGDTGEGEAGAADGGDGGGGSGDDRERAGAAGS